MLHLFHHDYLRPVSCHHRASIMYLEINNPNPVPVWEVVANFVNSLEYISAAIPSPVSMILTIAVLVTFSFLSWRSLSFIVIVMVPSFVKLTALINKLSMTRAILFLISIDKNTIVSCQNIKFYIIMLSILIIPLFILCNSMYYRCPSTQIFLFLIVMIDSLFWIRPKYLLFNLFNLFPFLIIASINSPYCSILPFLDRISSDSPIIGCIGVLKLVCCYIDKFLLHSIMNLQLFIHFCLFPNSFKY